MSDISRTEPSRDTAFAVLRRFARRPSSAEHCELCGAEIGPEHRHLLEPVKRQISCSCHACSVLFPGHAEGRYRLIPTRARLLLDFDIVDAQWDSLMIPINLAFFYRDSASGKVIAAYPSPAGATESLLGLENWEEITAEHPILRTIEPDVEALLVNRVGETRQYFIAPIDECYRLVGIIRMNWRGLAGGTQVWKQIETFFADLTARCDRKRESRSA